MQDRRFRLERVLQPSLVRPRQPVGSFIGTWMLKHYESITACPSRTTASASTARPARAARLPHRLRSRNGGTSCARRWTVELRPRPVAAVAHVGKVKAETLQDNETRRKRESTSIRACTSRRRTTSISRRPTRCGIAMNLRAGVNNLFDNDPPLVTGGNAGVRRYQPLPGRSV